MTKELLRRSFSRIGWRLETVVTETGYKLIGQVSHRGRPLYEVSLVRALTETPEGRALLVYFEEDAGSLAEWLAREAERPFMRDLTAPELGKEQDQDGE